MADGTANAVGGVGGVPESRFTGGAIANALIGWVGGLISLITLGLAYPAMVCWKQRWIANHTYINGRRLQFDGKAMQLFGKFIVWMLLTIVTLGIYYLLKGALLMHAWVAKHTHFEDGLGAVGDEDRSRFTGNWLQFFCVRFIAGFVTIITLFIGSFWAHCYKERWFAKHTYIDGANLCFDGTALEYFGKRIVWLILTVITLFIYVFWLKVKTKKWTVKHTHIA